MTGERQEHYLYGKYRGRVADNRDPLALGRVLVDVPVLGDALSWWAMPCAPYVGTGAGTIAVPPVEALVWVEFEGGDPNYPVWTGCYWSADNPPVVVMPG